MICLQSSKWLDYNGLNGPDIIDSVNNIHINITSGHQAVLLTRMYLFTIANDHFGSLILMVMRW